MIRMINRFRKYCVSVAALGTTLLVLSISYVLIAQDNSLPVSLTFYVIDEVPSELHQVPLRIPIRDIAGAEEVMIVRHLRHARVERDHAGMFWVLAFRLNEEDSSMLMRVTSDNVGSSLALVVDGRIISMSEILFPIEADLQIGDSYVTADTPTKIKDILVNSGRLVVSKDSPEAE
ncbi:hypothetical protein BVY04_03970 [bacterium M21]|nr:hypothetical protein BVY04_03970 [bacterium M21]